MTRWTHEDAPEHCEDPAVLARFIQRRLPEIHEQGDGTPYEAAQFAAAVGRLFELALQGRLPPRWAAAHLRRLAKEVAP